MMNDGPQSPETPTLVEQLFQQEEAETGSISKVHPNTMTSTTDSGLRDELDNERDMLVQQAKGALGFVERIPLPIKLIMLTLISTLGVIVLTGVLIAIVARQLHETSVTNRYIKNLVPADIFAKCIRTERSPSLIYMAEGRAPVHLQSVLSARSCIDNAIQPLRAMYSEYLSVAKDSVAQTHINTVEESYKTLPVIRGVVLGTINNGIDVTDVMNWYADFIEQVLFLIDDYYRNLGDTSNSGPVYSSLFHLAGSVARLRGSGDILFNSEFSVKSYANLYAAVERFKQSEVEFIAIADSTLLNKYHTQTMNTVFRNNTWTWAQMAINQTYQNASFLEQWDSNATAWVNALIALEVDTLAQFTASATKNNSMSIFYICIVVLLPIIVLICSLVFGIIFAKTITGPWQRLNRLQQETISKFVPISFLHAIKCNSIAEAELGKFVQNETVILFCEIGDFYITTKNLKPQELINFLNSFFKAMCPSTRNHGGFIDKYTPDGFIALLRRRKDAFAAGVEMQNALVRFNEQLPKGVSPISMCVAIHAANTIVGVVGESDSSTGRISGVSLSNGIHITRKLAAMGLKLECKMIVSEGLIPNVKKKMAYRQVGRIYDTDSDDIPFVDAYDVFSSAEFIKISSKHIYTQAMTQLKELF
jgi:class 3 adenylate cyclase